MEEQPIRDTIRESVRWTQLRNALGGKLATRKMFWHDENRPIFESGFTDGFSEAVSWLIQNGYLDVARDEMQPPDIFDSSIEKEEE